MNRYSLRHVPALCAPHTRPSPARLSKSHLRVSAFSSVALRTADVSLGKSSGYILHLVPGVFITRRLSSSLLLATSPQPLRQSGAAMAQRHTHASQAADRKINGTAQNHTQGHDDHHDHDHSHSHSIFGHSHSHNGENGHSHDAEQIVATLRGDKRDRGSYITLVGLASNVVLTATKGAAGWFLHSASLLADAGHSLSDLLGDFVVLFCWNLSRKPPSERYPYGFAKFETLGTTTISLLLIGGALGIGVHSYQLLLATLSETLPNIPPGVLHDAVENVTLIAPDLPIREHSHVHAVDVNAAWFAAIGVIVKEWLYWITKRVADQEHSPVLLANAIHHRSDAYSSAVAFFAILGTWYFPALPLDPIGGLLVSLVILRQGYSLLKGAWGDLTDAGISRRKQESLQRTLTPLLKTGIYDDTRMLIGVEKVRARRAGSMLFVDLTAKVDAKLSVAQITELEHKITKTMQEAKKEVAEVRVRFEPVSSS